MADPSPAPIRKNMPTAEYSPTAGCAIFVIGGIVILGLVGWMLFAGWKQSKEIETFTDTKSVKLPVVAPAPEKLAALHLKLEAYSQAIQENKAAELSLNKDEILLLLASEESLNSIKEYVTIEEIGDHIKAPVSLPLNGLGQKRFLNGVIEFTPVIKPSKGVAIQTESVTVPGKTVTEGFAKLYRDMDFLDDMLLKAFRDHPTLGPPFQKTTSIRLSGGSVILNFAPSASPTPHSP